MVKLRKVTALALSLVLAGAVLAGCGKDNQGQQQQQTGTGSQQGAQTQEPRTLNVVMGLGEEEWKVMREKIFPKFEQENNVKINAYQVEASQVVQQLEAMKNAGKMEIDLITQDNMHLPVLVNKGLVEDLTQYKHLIPDTAIPGVVQVGEFNGKTYFLPYRPNVEINYYNEAKFNEYGLQPPRTWDELLNVAKTFYEKEGVGKVGLKLNMAGDMVIQIVEFIYQAGGDPLKLNDEGSVKAFNFLKEIYPYLNPDSAKADWNTTNRFIAQDSFYLAANWPFGVGIIVRDGGKKEIKAYGGWRGPVKAAKLLGGESIAIPVGAPNKDLALKFAEYLMSKEVQETLAAELAWPSYRTDAYAKVEDWQKPYFEAINEAMKNATPRPPVLYWDELNKAITDAFREIVLEGKDTKATLDKYAEVVKQAAAKYGQ
ncbi:MAG: extracellular solute-binding protein [Bacillota bacterium]|nr:MAG: sugar ABC transporter substrate-binding protein [Bacillota bacterium]